MAAASREALAASVVRLTERTARSRTDTLSRLGDDLFAVAGLLVGQPALRRALTDPSGDAASRTRLARRLLDGKVSPTTLDVLTDLVSARWSAPMDLVDATEQLGRLSYLILAEKSGRLDAVEDELFRLGRIIAGQPDLERLLSDPAADPAGRRELMTGLLAGKVDRVTTALVTDLVGSRRVRAVVTELERLSELAAQRREQSIAYVRSAVALTEQQHERLARLLERIYQRPIAVRLEVDPRLLGGLVIRVGDELVDGSVAGRLGALRRAFAR
jgi:F-type H+-transporting ATPase subunit delta